MIISRAEIDSVVSAYRTSTARQAAAADSVRFDSAVTYEPSESATAMQELVSQVISDPFYRDRKVEDLKRRVAEGKYFVPAEQIVEKLLGRLMVEASVRN